MVIRPVSYAEILDAPNAKELLKEYAAECSIPEIGAIDPQAEIYARMEAASEFQVMGAYEDDELVGFAAVLPYLNPHYGKKIATVESLFLSDLYRTGRAGNALMNAIEDYAKGCGCEAILYSARTGSRFEKLLSMLTPYECSHSVFLRYLQ